MYCLFSAGEHLSNISHGRDQRRCGVVGCDDQFAYTLMVSASSTKPHFVQFLLTSHCKQIEHTILRCLCCTLPASPSSLASRNTRTHTHTHPHASSTDSADRRYVHRGSSSVSRISLPLFDRKPSKSAGTQRHQNENFLLVLIPPHSFFDLRKMCLDMPSCPKQCDNQKS